MNKRIAAQGERKVKIGFETGAFTAVLTGASPVQPWSFRVPSKLYHLDSGHEMLNMERIIKETRG